MSSSVAPFFLHRFSFSFDQSSFVWYNFWGQLNVYEQLINSFQHVYGSALASYEINAKFSDVLFRANEYFESVFWRNSGTVNFYLDTKKDLGNNEIGRRIGQRARQLELLGAKAEDFMLNETLEELRQGKVYAHFLDQRIDGLPSLEDYGCPWLFEIQELRQGDHNLRAQLIYLRHVSQ